MTLTPPDSSDVTIMFLRPAPPIRAFLIAGVSAIVGAVLLVAANQYGWHIALAAVGGVLVGLGVVLLLVAATVMARMRVRAELTPTGYSFRTPAGVRHGTWARTTKVTASETGHRLTFVHPDDTADHVVTPLGFDDPQMRDLVAEITRRLEASRR